MIEVAKMFDDAIIPDRKHHNDAGMDLYYYGDSFNLKPHSIKILGTGVRVKIPKGFMGKIEMKGRTSYIILGGIIDEGYQGEILVKVANVLDQSIGFNKGDAIAQLVIYPCLVSLIREVEDSRLFIEESMRGKSGRIVDQKDDDWYKVSNGE